MDLPNISISDGVDSAVLAELRVHVPGYRLVGILGRGGQATVYKAIDLADGAPVAIKILHGGPLADADARVRFKREILAIKAVNHPSIVTHRTSGQTPAGDDYLVMNFVEGERLDEYLWKSEMGAPLNLQARLLLFLKICRAVGEAHRAGITHRDLSPSNITVDTAGEPHILDFGLARTAFDGFFAGRHGSVTETHQFVGKLGYASPEQVGGARAPIDIRSDVYSLGVILYQILADGRLPYDVGGSMAEALDKILKKIPEPPVVTGLRDEQDPLRRRAGSVALHALQKRPGDRPESANALAWELEQCVAGRRSPLSVSRKRFVVWSVATAAMLLLPLGLWLSAGSRSSTIPAHALPSLAAAFPLTPDQAEKIQQDYAGAAGLPITTSLNIDSTTSIKFALIPPGQFQTDLSDESSPYSQKREHSTTISHAFYLATTPITVAQFTAFTKQTKFITHAEEAGVAFTYKNDFWHVTPDASWHNPGFEQSLNDPVVEITWPDAVAFCGWLSKTTGRRLILPTSAQWEYACRAGTSTRFYVGDTWPELEKAAWCRLNSSGRTHPVAQKIPNAWGLYDMHGNASQWCQDWFSGPVAGDGVDPVGPDVGEQRVKRGGSWLDNFPGTGSAVVACNHPNTADSIEGFRILLEVPPSNTLPRFTAGERSPAAAPVSGPNDQNRRAH